VRAHHRALLDAVGAKDAERAAKVADDHLRTGAELAARMGGRSELSPQPLPAA
jgi:DNA-binding GntR family transcriptional regulator